MQRIAKNYSSIDFKTRSDWIKRVSLSHYVDYDFVSSALQHVQAAFPLKPHVFNSVCYVYKMNILRNAALLSATSLCSGV